MTITVPRRGLSSGLSRILAAVVTSVVLVAAPVLMAAPAQAATGDYVGEPSGSSWPDGTLGVMTAGVPYNDSLTSPIPYDSRYGGLSSVGLPSWLSFGFRNATEIWAQGTPEAGPFDFTLTVGGETPESLHFTGTVQEAKTSTTTSVTAPVVAPYTSIPLSAVVTPASGPTGTVQFSIGGTTSSDALESSAASGTAAVDASNSGSTLTTTATYSGDADYATSSDTADTYIYGSGTVSGFVRVDGAAVDGAVVELLDSAAALVDQKTTAADGRFTFTRTVTTVEDADAKYVLKATIPAGYGLPANTVLYYATDGTVASASTFAAALKTGPVDWIGTDRNFYYYFTPTWTDQLLATPRHNAEYSDSVSAGGSAPISYTVSAGSLPVGLSLNASTGLVSGTPTAESAYAFTVKAQNGYGSVTKSFSGTVLPAGTPPTWTDKVLADLQAKAAFDDGVTASGDPTITYAVSAGALPSGLALNSSTGAITGTPTSAGEYDFTVTATNDYGHVDQRFTGTVAAAPVIDLKLDFTPGTSITDAASTISADGLKVGSTYTLTMHSTPVILYTGTIGASGGFTWKVALPADTPAGAHRLILTGVAPDGSTMTREAWFTLGANGTISAISYTGPTALAYTGADDPALPLGFATSLLLFGVFAMLVARRRRHQRE